MIRKIRRWKSWGAGGIVTCLMLFSLLSGCMEENQDDDGDDFTFKALDGTVKHLRDYRGKVVVLDMWATWCTPCLTQMIELTKVYENYSWDDLEILSINIDPRDNVADIQSYLENLSIYNPQRNFGWIFGQDGDGSIWFRYHLEEQGIPALCVFDRRGHLRFSQEGVTMFSEIPLGYPQNMTLLRPILNDLMGEEGSYGDDFAFLTLDGTVKHLRDYRGKVVVLDMWATWCTPCVFQMTELLKVYDNYSRDDLEILSIDVDTEENTTVIRSYLQNFSQLSGFELEWVFGRDIENSIWLRYHLEEEGIPTLYIFDRSGIPRFSREGITWFNKIPQGYSLDTPLLKSLLDDIVS